MGTVNLLAARRPQVLQFMISTLQKLAATRDLAIVILTQCATKMQAEQGAHLVPSINASVWEQGISTRLVLFRDWMIEKGDAVSIHLAGVQKLNGKPSQSGFEDVVAFKMSPVSNVQSRCHAPRPLIYPAPEWPGWRRI